jgi:small subunit ribosomal protein S9
LENVYTATGRRKNAIACVILKPGKGDRIINGKNVKAYIKSDTLIMEIEKPFDLLQTNTSFDAFVRVRGGGVARIGPNHRR